MGNDVVSHILEASKTELRLLSSFEKLVTSRSMEGAGHDRPRAEDYN